MNNNINNNENKINDKIKKNKKFNKNKKNKNNNDNNNKKINNKNIKNKKKFKRFKNKNKKNKNKLINKINNKQNNDNINNLIDLHTSPEQYNIKKRNNYISWNDYFMSLAFLSAMRSKDPSTQVGACIVDQDNHIVSIGYNGFPSGICDDILPWSRQCPLKHDETNDYISSNVSKKNILKKNESQDIIHTHTHFDITHQNNDEEHNINDEEEDERKTSIHTKSDDCILNTKYPYVCHAEMNAILNKYTHTLEGCKIYIALFPCNECAKLIIQSGIKEVIYMSDKYHDTYTCIASRTLFDLCNVKYEQYIPTTKRLVIDFSAIDNTLF